MRVKICGITRLEDALSAADAGADALGFIFVGSSPRYVEYSQAAEIIRALPPVVIPVGVFVNAARDEIDRAIRTTGIRCLQLHGDERPEDVLGYPVPVIKGFRVTKSFNPERLRQYQVAAHLLDAYVEGLNGGTGMTFDWKVALEAKKYGRIILSGGLTPGNVTEAVRAVLPYAVDVSSGVESSPGVKERETIIRFIAASKQAAEVVGHQTVYP